MIGCLERERRRGHSSNSTGLRCTISFGGAAAPLRPDRTILKRPNELIALLSVHSAKGLEFDVVFVVGMVDGIFPDYRATTKKQKDEERRNAFVAVTRSKRLLYLTYPKKRFMPWGDILANSPSPFIGGGSKR